MGAEALTIVLLLRAFASGSVALTGVEAIANGVPAFKPPEVEERGEHDGHDGGPAGHDLHRRDPRGTRVRHRPVGVAVGRPDGDRARRADRLRRREPALLPVPDRDRADPVPGREHELQRVPAAGRDPGRGRLLPAPVQLPRRPPRLQLGDHPPGRDRGRHLRRLPGQHDQPDPALLRRRVRVLHAVAGRHGPPLGAHAGTRLAVADGRQRVRRPAHAGRPRRSSSPRSSAAARSSS